MKGTKLLLSLWLATAVFCLLQILFGPGGMTEAARLREQQSLLDARLAALQEDNARLTARYEALRTSQEAVRLEARALGWFRPGEVPVRTLDGSDFRLPSEEPDLSTVPPLAESTTNLTWFFRLAWPLLVIIFFTLFYLYERIRPHREQWKSALRERTENLPVVFQSGLDFFRK